MNEEREDLFPDKRQIKLKEVLKDTRMSARTKGVLAIILFSSQEERNMKTLAELCHLSINVLQKEVSFLEKLGYLKRERERREGKFVGWIWKIPI